MLLSQVGMFIDTDKVRNISLLAAAWEKVPLTCMPIEDSDKPAHSHGLVRIVPGRILDSLGCNVSSCWQRRLYSDCAGLVSLRRAHVSEGKFYHVAVEIKLQLLLYCDVNRPGLKDHHRKNWSQLENNLVNQTDIFCLLWWLFTHVKIRCAATVCRNRTYVTYIAICTRDIIFIQLFTYRFLVEESWR